MRLALALLAFMLSVAGCAPSAELRIPNPDGPLPPGRLVVVPVSEGLGRAVIDTRDDVAARAEFETPEAHEEAFWDAFVARLNAELPGFDVRMGDPVYDASLEPRRALVQGAGAGYGRDRWTVETVVLPSMYDVQASGADYVLYVRDIQMTTDVGSQAALFGAAFGMAGAVIGSAIPKKGVGIGADAALVRAADGSPVFATRMGGVQGGGGLLGTRVDREVWQQAVGHLATGIARRASGPSS